MRAALAFLEMQPCSSGRGSGGVAVNQSGLACVLASPSLRCYPSAAHGRPAGQRGATLPPAAIQRHVANSAALVERTVALDHEDSVLLSAENERRRRSLEQTFRGAPGAEPDEAQQQQDQAGPSQRLDASWQTPDGVDPSSNSSSSRSSRQERPSAQPSSRRQPKQRKSAATAASTATVQRPTQAAADDEADRSDHQLLSGALKSLNGRSLASRRAARRTTGQGRVETEDTAGFVRPAAKQQPEKLGPADTFLRALQERLYKSRSAKRATASDAVSWYLHSVGNTNVLTRNEEVQLGAIMHLGSTVRQAQQDLQAANGSEPSLDEVTRHLKLRSVATVQQRLRNAALAKELLLQYNVKLVISVARQYADRGVEFSDLLPAGVGGLERAIDRFDAAKGFKFSTYAHWWIRQAISRCVQDQSRVVRLPVNVYELLSKINKVSTRLNAQPDRQKPATYSEIAKALDLSVAKVMQVVRVSREAKSLDTPVDQSGSPDAADSPALVDTLEADVGDSQENSSQRALKEQVDLALKGLELRPRNILRYRYGLHHALGRALTLNEVGELYGLKGERVRQIEGVAMAMLKKGLEHGLRRTLEETPED